jgi:hypothetical protein
MGGVYLSTHNFARFVKRLKLENSLRVAGGLVEPGPQESSDIVRDLQRTMHPNSVGMYAFRNAGLLQKSFGIWVTFIVEMK